MHPMIERPVRLVAYLGVAAMFGGLLALLVQAIAPGSLRGALALCLPLALVYGFQCLSVWYPVRQLPASRAGAPRLVLLLVVASFASAAIWTVGGPSLGAPARRIGRLRRSPGALRYRAAALLRRRCFPLRARDAGALPLRRRRALARRRAPGARARGARPRGRAQVAQGAARSALPLQQPELGLGAHRLGPAGGPAHVLPDGRLLPQEPRARAEAEHSRSRRRSTSPRPISRSKRCASARGCAPASTSRRRRSRSPCRRSCCSR